MQNQSLDRAIEALKIKALPKAPFIDAEVLQAVRTSGARSKRFFHFDWLEASLSPRFAAACLAMVFISSIGGALLSSSTRQVGQKDVYPAAVALGFESFQPTELLTLSTPSPW